MSNHTTEPFFIGPQQIMIDWGVSKATAYNIIKKMNAQLKEKHPTALVIPGKVNRIWYTEACLLTSSEKDNRKTAD